MRLRHVEIRQAGRKGWPDRLATQVDAPRAGQCFYPKSRGIATEIVQWHFAVPTLRTWVPGAGRRWGRDEGGGWRRLRPGLLAIPGRCGGRRCVACSSAGREG